MEKYTHSLTLEKPVTFGTQTVTEVHFNAPTGREMRKMRLQADGAVEQSSLVDVFAACSDQPPPFFDHISAADYIAVLGQIGPFIGGGQ